MQAFDVYAEKECDAVQQEDRLSTATPSICEEQAVEEAEDAEQHVMEKVAARLSDQAAKPRWADVFEDSDEEGEALWPTTVVGGEQKAAASTARHDVGCRSQCQQDREESQGSWKGRAGADSKGVRHENGKGVSKGKGKSSAECYGKGSATGNHTCDARSNGKGNAKGNGKGSAKGNNTCDAKGNGKGDAKGNGKGGAKGNGKGSAEGYGKGSAKGNITCDAKGNGKGGAKGNGKGGSKGNGKGGAKVGDSKCQCQFHIGIEEEPDFRVCRRLLGPKGQHMKDIAEETGAKLRLRGRGSKFLEGPNQQESSDPLMLCLSATDACAYHKAKSLVSHLLEGIYQQFKEFQVSQGTVPADVKLNIHEGPREGSW